MVRTDSSSHVEEADDAEAATQPAHETLDETLNVKRDSLHRREGVLHGVSDRIVFLLTTEIFPEQFILLMDLVDIPRVFKSVSMLPPGVDVNRPPDCHSQGKESSHWGVFNINKQAGRQPADQAEKGGENQKLLEVVHPFEVDSVLISIVTPDYFYRSPDCQWVLHVLLDRRLLSLRLFPFKRRSRFGV